MPSDNNQEMFPIVDEQGNITGAATRGECHSGSTWYRRSIVLSRIVRYDDCSW